MQERQLLEIDPLFADHFFDMPQQCISMDDLQALVKFPLPASAEQFCEFQGSDQGKLFRDGFSSILDELLEFTGVKNENLKAIISLFKSQYVDISGADLGLTQICIPLYQFGAPYLAGILKLLHNDGIPQALRQDVANNLLSQLNVCAPGIYTHIVDTYMRLQSYLNVGNDFLLFRTEICRQLTSEVILKIRGYVNQGMEIHYSNAIINRFGDTLGLQCIEDLFVSSCDAQVMEFLLAAFEKNIHKFLTADNFFDRIIDGLNLQQWAERLKLFLESGDFKSYNDAVKLVEDKLNLYGLGAYSIHDLCVMSDDMMSVTALSVKARCVLYLSLLQRMQSSGYLSSSSHSLLCESDDVQVYYFPLRSLKFAYVDDSGQKLPFLPYFVDALMNESRAVSVMDSAIFDHSEIQSEVIDYVISYLNSSDVGPEKYFSPEITNLLFYLSQAYMSKWSEIVDRLAPAFKHPYMSTLFFGAANDDLRAEALDFYFRVNADQRSHIINLLLGLEQMLDKVNDKGKCALHTACAGNYVAIVTELLRLGASPDFQDKNGSTPLMYACNAGNIEIVEILLKKKSTDVNHKANYGMSVLHIACLQGDVRVIDALLLAGADVNVATKEGFTPLHQLCLRSHYVAVNQLIKFHVNVNQCSSTGKTALEIAVDNKDLQLALILLRAGAVTDDLPKVAGLSLLRLLTDNEALDMAADVLSRLLKQYIDELAVRKYPDIDAVIPGEKRVTVVGDWWRKKGMLQAKISSANTLFAILENNDGGRAPLISVDEDVRRNWSDAQAHSKRMKLFVETCDRLSERGVIKYQSHMMKP